MKPRSILMLSFAIVFAFLLVACNSASNNNAEEIVAWVRPAANYVKPPDYILEAVHKKILDDTGVNLKVVVGPSDSNEFYTKLNNALSAGEQIDIVQVPSKLSGSFNSSMLADIKTYYDQGMIANLTDALNKYGSNIMERQGEENMNACLIDGGYYGVPRNAATPAAGYPVWIRGDWLEKYGLDIPTTIDEFENALKVFAENDPAGNGTTIPLMSNGITGNIMSLSAAWLENSYNDLNGQFVDKDGRLMPSILSPGFKEYLLTVNEWYNNGYMPKDNYIMPSSDQYDMIKSGRVGAWAGWFAAITQNEGAMQVNHPDAYYEKLALEGTKGYAQSFFYDGGTWTSAYVVFNKCKDIEAAVKVLNWGATEDNYIFSKYATDAEVEYTDGAYFYTVKKDPIGNDYQGLFLTPTNETRFQMKGGDPLLQRHLDYTTKPPIEMDDLRYGKRPLTYGIRFDNDLLNSACPQLSDITRMIEENLMGFLTGTRSLGEYDDFVNQLYDIGFEDYIIEITRQYNELNKE